MEKLSDKELETLEHRYLKTIFHCLKQDENVFLSLLNSKEKIREDWDSNWNKNKKKYIHIRQRSRESC